jgi:hypothetical protein
MDWIIGITVNKTIAYHDVWRDLRVFSMNSILKFYFVCRL